MKTALGYILIILLLHGCTGKSPGQTSNETPSHELWNTLVQKFVNQEGMVDYKGFLTERTTLQSYLKLLSGHAPDENKWTKEAQIAYWINAYNAYTIELILENYPLESIKDIGSKIQIPFVNTPWDVKFFSIGGEEMDLNHIEHGILRKKFNEPRIHFAINCASFSCPLLRKEAFTGDQLDRQLEEQAVLFINDPKRNQISENEIRISKIFRWFKGDFTKESSLVEFLNRYSSKVIRPDAEVKHLDYNWNLNEN